MGVLGRMLEAPSVAACLLIGAAAGCGGSTSSPVDSDLSAFPRDNHRVALAYARFSKSQSDCIAKAQASGATSDADIAACFDQGLTLSQLQIAIETMRRRVIQIGQEGSADCKRAADRLASTIGEEEAAVKAQHADLATVDARAFQADGTRGNVVAGNEGKQGIAMVRACR
jgi:hypothetical protein